MFKIGLSTCFKKIDETLFAQYQKNKIDAMEISTEYQNYASLNYKEIRSLANQYDITLWSYHLPFQKMDEVDISNKELQKHTIESWSELIKKGVEIGIDKFVAHPSTEPIEENERKDKLEYSKEGLAKLADVAKEAGAVIAVENLPRTCLGNCHKEIKELISYHDDLKVCFDTNHLLFEDAVDFIHQLSNKIITTHVSDFDFINERHWLPGEGKLDWQKLISTLKEVNYQGIWLYELAFVLPKTLYRERELNCGDIRKNADELFQGKELTILSKPKENLGMWE